MTRFVALLRAVNVGGHASLPMSALRDAAAAAGLGAPRTLLQSGNLLFDSYAGAAVDLQTDLERVLADRCGLRATVFARAAPDWRSLVDHVPFPEMARLDPAHLVAMLLRDSPGDDQRLALERAVGGREQFAIRGATIYVAYPDGIGRSKLTPALIERCLATQGTGRNWRTVLKIQAALASP